MSAGLSRTSGCGDVRLQAFIAQIRERSPRFEALWNEGQAAAHQSMVKTVHSPLVGDITLDCDVVTVTDTDIKLVVYSTTKSSPDAAKLDFLRVGALRTPIAADA